MRMIFLGPPGAGKGTQAVKLAEHFKLPHIATGDMLRQAVAAGTGLGLEAKRYMDAGELVPDSVTNGLVRERISQRDAEKGFILDGYPRNVEQAEELDRALDEMGAKLDRVILFRVEHDEVVKRLSGRRTCPSCQATYHVTARPPAVDGICDNDHTPLMQREDDREETIINRLRVYEEQTAPLCDYYRKRGQLLEIQALRSAEEVFDRLLEVTER